MLIINPRGVGPDGIRIAGELAPEEVELCDAMLGFTAPLRYDLRVEPARSDLVIRGRVETVVEAVCDRCAEWFRLPLALDSFVHVVSGGAGLDEVDLTPRIREDMILALPHKTLCRTDCRGLCPSCGANLNERSCGCEPGGGDSSWQALDSLDVQGDS